MVNKINLNEIVANLNSGDPSPAIEAVTKTIAELVVEVTEVSNSIVEQQQAISELMTTVADFSDTQQQLGATQSNFEGAGDTESSRVFSAFTEVIKNNMGETITNSMNIAFGAFLDKLMASELKVTASPQEVDRQQKQQQPTTPGVEQAPTITVGGVQYVSLGTLNSGAGQYVNPQAPLEPTAGGWMPKQPEKPKPLKALTADDIKSLPSDAVAGEAGLAKIKEMLEGYAGSGTIEKGAAWLGGKVGTFTKNFATPIAVAQTAWTGAKMVNEQAEKLAEENRKAVSAGQGNLINVRVKEYEAQLQAMFDFGISSKVAGEIASKAMNEGLKGQQYKDATKLMGKMYKEYGMEIDESWQLYNDQLRYGKITMGEFTTTMSGLKGVVDETNLSLKEMQKIVNNNASEMQMQGGIGYAEAAQLQTYLLQTGSIEALPNYISKNYSKLAMSGIIDSSAPVPQQARSVAEFLGGMLGQDAFTGPDMESSRKAFLEDPTNGPMRAKMLTSMMPGADPYQAYADLYEQLNQDTSGAISKYSNISALGEEAAAKVDYYGGVAKEAGGGWWGDFVANTEASFAGDRGLFGKIAGPQQKEYSKAMKELGGSTEMSSPRFMGNVYVQIDGATVGKTSYDFSKAKEVNSGNGTWASTFRLHE